MADLSDIQAGQTVKIVGSNSTGVEQTPVNSTANGDMNTADILNNGGVNGIIAVSTTAVAVRVGASNLANRKRLTFMNNGTATLFWGYDSGVSTSNGFPIFRNQPVSDAWGPNTTIWIIAASGTHPVPVNEAA